MRVYNEVHTIGSTISGEERNAFLMDNHNPQQNKIRINLDSHENSGNYDIELKVSANLARQLWIGRRARVTVELLNETEVQNDEVPF